LSRPYAIITRKKYKYQKMTEVLATRVPEKISPKERKDTVLQQMLAPENREFFEAIPLHYSLLFLLYDREGAQVLEPYNAYEKKEMKEK